MLLPRAPRLPLCAALLLLGCSSQPGPGAGDRALLQVAVSGLPAGATTLRLAAMLSDAAGSKHPTTSVQEFSGDLTRLDLRLPSGASGALLLRAEVSDGACLLARGTVSVPIAAPPPAEPISAVLALRALATPLCVCGDPNLCYEHPATTALTLTSAAYLGPGQLFVGGERGMILRHDGARWLRQPSDASVQINGLWGSGTDNLWAVGAQTILRYSAKDGTFRSALRVASDLRAVWGSGAGDVWAVGKGGAALHYSGSSWTAAYPGTAQDLLAVSGTSSRDVWVGGTGVISHFDGNQWSAITTIGGAAVGEVKAVATSGPVVWALGDSLKIYGSMDRGGTWTATSLGNGLINLEGVVMGGAGVLTVGGKGGGRSYHGFVGQGIPTLAGYTDGALTRSYDLNLHAVASSGSDAVAVGDAGTVAWLSGGKWSISDGDRPNRITAIVGSSEDNVWAVGEGLLLRYDGVRWTEVTRTNPYDLNPSSVSALWTSAPNDVWLGGALLRLGGTSTGLVHFDGQTWTSVAEASKNQISLLYGTGPGDVYAIDSGQGVALHYDGAAWSLADAKTLGGAVALWGAGPKDLWAITKSGAISRFDGKSWAQVSLPVGSGELNRLWGSGSADVWAAGQKTVLRFDGSTWAQVAAPLLSSDQVLGLGGSGPRDVSLLLNGGGTLHYDGSVWLRLGNDLAQAGDLSALWVAPSGDLWLGGQSATVLRQRL